MFGWLLWYPGLMATKFRPSDYTVIKVQRKAMEEARFTIMDAELKTYTVRLDNTGEWSVETTSGDNIHRQAALVLIAVSAEHMIGRIKAVIP